MFIIIHSTLRARTHWRQRLCRRFVAVDIVAKVKHAQLGRLCGKWVVFVAFVVFRQVDCVEFDFVASVYRP